MATFIVTTSGDSGAGSLRQAIADAAAAPGADTINFAAGLANATIRLTSGPLAIAAGNDVTIDASAGAGGATGVIISGDSNSSGVADDGDTSLFNIAAGATVTLDALTLTHGFARGANGTFDQQTPGGTVAGGIVNRGSLTLLDTILSNNAAIGGAGSDGYALVGDGGSAAGGVLNYGTLTVTGGAFAANDAAGGKGGFGFVPPYASRGGHAAGGILNLGGAVNLTGVSFDGAGSNVAGGNGGPGFNYISGLPGHAAGGILNIGTLTDSASGSGFTVTPGSPGGLTAGLAMTLGSGGADNISGFAGPQTVHGFGGGDSLKGGGGADQLFGGDGNDNLSVEDGHAVSGEIYDGGADADTLTLYSNGNSDFDFRGSTVTALETLAYANLSGIGATAHFLAGQFAFTALNLNNGVQVTTVDMGTVTALDLSALVITGAGADDRFEIAGDGDAESITGSALPDAIAGAGGNDTLRGGMAADTLTGGANNDTYADVVADDASGPDSFVEVAGGGAHDRIVTDRGALSLAPFAEIEDLIGTAPTNALTGNAKNNVLTGAAGADTLDGGDGNDTMDGGEGDDLYTVNSRHDAVTETTSGAAGGNDTVSSAASTFTLGANVEDLTLTGAKNSEGIGNELANRITGNTGRNALKGLDGADTLTGGDGDDELRGGIDADRMNGGNGNDRFFVDASGDQTIETNANAATGGIDTVFTTVSRTLNANIENLRLQGSDPINGTGNELNNKIFGNAGANLLKGLAGNDTIEGRDGADTIEGGEGNDTLSGGSQADVFRFASTNTGVDRILDFNKNADRFDLSGGTFTALTTAANGDTVLTHAGGAIRIATPPNLTLAEWNALVLPSGGRVASDGARAATAHDASGAGPHTGGGHPLLMSTDTVSIAHHGEWLYA